MAFINKKNLDKVYRSIWPNPFHLKENELIGDIEDLPIEVVTLALIEMIQQRPRLKKPLEELSKHGLNGSFSWYDTIYDKDDFWRRINARDFDIFYKRYTPSKLLDKIKEVKNTDYAWERKITI